MATLDQVKNLDKLKDTFGPIDNEAEAASFIGVVTGDLVVSGDIATGRTAVINDGFLVEVVRNNTYGCGSHKPTRVIYKVSRYGDMQQVAVEQQPKIGSMSEICTD